MRDNELTDSYVEAFDEWADSGEEHLWDQTSGDGLTGRGGMIHRQEAETERQNMIGILPQLDRITQDPGIMGGKACIRGMRVTVGMVVAQIGAGYSPDEILADYPYLEREDIAQSLRYTAWRADEREVELAAA